MARGGPTPWVGAAARRCYRPEAAMRSRYVGLRTNTLVMLSFMAMMAFGAKLPTGDPTAIVHITSGIMTRIGFLSAGVLIHEGIMIKGCNTAATVWYSVAVEPFFCGSGLFRGGGTADRLHHAGKSVATPDCALYNINSQTKHKETAGEHHENSRG